LLTTVLADHLERTAPVGEPEHMVSAHDGYRVIPATEAPRCVRRTWTPARRSRWRC
jgi:hypothetical protein